MSRFVTSAVIALCCGLWFSGPSAAQGTGMPAGRAAATAPGGTEGIAGPANVRRAIRRGQAVGYRRRTTRSRTMMRR